MSTKKMPPQDPQKESSDSKESGQPSLPAQPGTVNTEQARADELTQAKAELRRSNVLLNTLIETTPAAIAVFDTDLRFLYYSRRWLEVYGLGDQNLRGRHHYDVFPEIRDMPYLQEIHQRTLAGETLGPEEYLFQQANGREIWGLWETKPWFDENGAIGGLILITIDLTERKQAEEALRESERRLTLAQEVAHVGYYELDLQTGDAIWSDETFRIFGLEPRRGKTPTMVGYQEYVHPEDRAGLYALVAQSSAAGKPFDLIYRIIRADGMVRYVHSMGHVVRDAQDQPAKMFGTIQDITERRQAEEELQFRAELLNAVGQAIIATDVQGEIIYMNPAAEALYGWPKAEAVGKNILDVTVPHISHAQGSEIMASLAAGKSWSGEFLVQRRDGTTFPAIVHDTPIIDQTGNLVGIIGISNDITERKQAEEALRQSEENLRITLNSITEAVAATDTAGHIIRLNPQAETLSGWSQAEAIGKPYRQIFPLIHAKTREPVSPLIKIAVRDGQTVELSKDVILTAKAGRECYVTVSAAPLQGLQGETPGAVLVLKDVTQQRLIDEELLKAGKLEAIGILAAGIAHNFNNLFAALFGNIELAKLALPPTHRAYLNLEKTDSLKERALELAGQMLTFAQGGAPVKDIHDVGQLLHQVAGYFAPGSKSEVTLDIAPDLWLAEVDQGQFSQAISNLLLNAGQSMPGGGLITIKGMNFERAGQAYIKITIQDEGLGIAPENLDKIFTPFFSVNPGRSGLGLTTAYSIIDRHDGQITVDSTLNQGTTITILLPATLTASRPAHPTFIDAAVPGQDSPARILILEDEEVVRLVIEAMLDQAGYEATLTSDGQATVVAYQQAMQQGNPYQAVILDLLIPDGMGGQEVARKILALDPQARLIVSSGYATDPVMADYQMYGFTARIAKPYRLKSLQQTLQAVLAPVE
jgi:PAS domain S-box-containing protein